MLFLTSRGGLWNWGWLLSWVAAVFSQCDYSQIMEVGTPYYVYSTNYPNLYPPGTQCRWYAEGPSGSTITMNCTVSIPPSTDCVGDRLVVSLSGDQQMSDAMNYCGDGTFQQSSVENKIRIALDTTTDASGGTFLCSIKAKGPPPTCDCGWTNQNRIVGGSETGINEYPMMAGLVDKNMASLFCGATIISNSYLVTAARCLERRSTSQVGVVVGEHDVSTGSDTTATKVIMASRFILHPGYQSDSEVNDIALVTTSQPIVFESAVGPACLPFQYKSSPLTGETVTALGWGAIFFGGPTSDALKQTELTVIPQADCASAKSDKQICTFQNNTDACQMDSGGPLLWQDPSTYRIQLVGVISSGTGCGGTTPGVNTRVAAYVDWMQSVTQESYCIP